jgi:hypothetical protein
MDLAELFHHYGSDKDRNGYSPLYATLLTALRLSSQRVRLIEVGIGTMIEGAPSSMLGYGLEGYRPGGSLRAWRDWFRLPRRSELDIVGLDIQPDTQFSEEGIRTALCDSTDGQAVESCFKKLGIPRSSVDVLIDDGLHLDTAQWATLKNMLPFVRDGGFYIIEDIYHSSRVSGEPERLEEYAAGYPYFFVGVKNNLCVVHKSPLHTRRLGY